jgi:hypothetical protein
MEGVVTDAATREPIAGAELVLRNQRGAVVARAETGADGRFVLPAQDPGPHTAEVRRLGYTEVPPLSIELGRDVVDVEIRLSLSPVPLDPLVVRGRRYDPRHDATWEGALARYDRLPSVGARRVVMRTDPEFAGSFVPAQVLRWFPRGHGCTIVFFDGRVATRPETAGWWLHELSTEDLEAIEFYRSWHDAPHGLQDVPPSVTSPSSCSVVALWPRTAPTRPLAWWKRVLYLAGSVVLLYMVGQVW